MTTGRGLLIYDGDCGFCTRSARWIERRWPDGGPVAVPSQSLGDDELSSLGLSRAAVMAEVCWSDGEPLRAERAVAAALVAAGGALGLVGRAIAAAPLRWAAAWAYPIVARHRHRLPGGTAACALPSEQAGGSTSRTR